MALSPAEQAMQQHVAQADDLPPETPDEASTRRLRNQREWQLARAAAVRRNDPKSVQMLDEEYRNRVGIDFPDRQSPESGALDLQPDASGALDLQPDAPVVAAVGSTGAPASQGAVRAFEQGQETPMDRQNRAEAQFEQDMKAWMKATGGLLKPGQNVRQAVAEWSGHPDPRDTRQQAEIDQFKQTGDITSGNSLQGQAAKALAAIGGFTAGGPSGASAAEAAVRAATLAYNLKQLIDSGAIDEEQAQQLFNREFASGVATDTAFNYGIPLVGTALGAAGKALASKIPGVQGLIDGAQSFLGRMLPPSAAGQSLRDAKIANRQALTENPDRQQAIQDLADRAQAQGSDVIVSPGQARGEASYTETNVRRGSPITFGRADRTLNDTADQMLRDVTTPEAQMSRQDLGNTIADTALKTQQLMKQRLRPVFDAADNLGVEVDMRPTRQIVSKALLADQKTPGGTLSAGERTELQNIFEQLRQQPFTSPEQVLDFISRRKEVLRDTTGNAIPSQRFTTLTNQLVDSATDAYQQAARSIGEQDVAANLIRAERQYRDVMGTVYTDAVRKALKSDPEAVGKLFWQTGNVSEIQQLNKLLGLAQREGAIGDAGSEKVKRDLTRGFLQNGVRNLDDAATWTQRLKERPELRETWDALTNNPDGRVLRNTMNVIEQAAQMTKSSNMLRAGTPAQIVTRAEAGSAGASLVTGQIEPGLFTLGISLTGLLRGLATAYTHGETGIMNSIAKVARLRTVGTPAATQAAQAEAGKLLDWYNRNGISPTDQQPAQPTQTAGS